MLGAIGVSMESAAAVLKAIQAPPLKPTLNVLDKNLMLSTKARYALSSPRIMVVNTVSFFCPMLSAVPVSCTSVVWLPFAQNVVCEKSPEFYGVVSSMSANSKTVN